MSLAQRPDKFEYFLGTDASFRPRLEAVLWQARTAVAQCILAHLAEGALLPVLEPLRSFALSADRPLSGAMPFNRIAASLTVCAPGFGKRSRAWLPFAACASSSALIAFYAPAVRSAVLCMDRPPCAHRRRVLLWRRCLAAGL